MHNNAIVGLLCSFLQCNKPVTNVTPWENGSLLYVVANHLKDVAFGSPKNITSDQKRREPQLSPGEKTFLRGQFGEKSLDFFAF